MRCWPKILIGAAILLCTSLAGWSQETRIVDFSADITEYDESIGKGIQRLLGNVWMKHKNLVLTCDSAYLDQANSRFHGFSRVHIIKADTLHIYSGQIDYNGKTEQAKLDHNVLMDNVVETLRAPALDYNMKEEIAWYYGGGQIIDSSNTVESYWGYYYVNQNMFVFKENVTMTNPDNTMVTDSLRYNSKTETMWFEGPTEVFSDTNYIACNRGYYDSKNKLSVFHGKVFMQAKEQNLKTDSLIYNQDNHTTNAFGNIELRDTVENMIVTGNRLFYDEGKNMFRVTENVDYVMIDEKDSLFLHSDTLISSREQEKNSRRIQAFPKVQFFRADLQGRCDSLDYLVVDSLIHLFREPVIWQEENQLTADTLLIVLKKGGIRQMDLKGSGFLITREDSIHYNQIKGKRITGFFENDQLSRVEVDGNGESLSYLKNEEDIIGQNKVLSSRIQIYFKDKKIDRISFVKDPDSKLVPMNDLVEKDLYLDGFRWLGDKRPLSREVLGIWK
jgi:lipopolysaccharide export system protein LptA